MSYQIVQCEVLWEVKCGYCVNGQLPEKWSMVGQFSSEGIARQILIDMGFTEKPYGWVDTTGRTLAYISRVLLEIK